MHKRKRARRSVERQKPKATKEVGARSASEDKQDPNQKGRNTKKQEMLWKKKK